MTHPVLAKVKYWDDVEEKMSTSVHILNAYNLTNAMEQLEDYYGDNLESVIIDIYEEGLIAFPANRYDEIKHILEGMIE